jgi:hypothetical protein
VKAAGSDVQRRFSAPPHPLASGKSEARALTNMPAIDRSTRRLQFSRPQDIVHCLLFIIEYSNSADPRWRDHRRHLNLFFSRDGGVHLLLMLLNAYYNKPPAGRRPGWVFSTMRTRIRISERALRMLINDAVADGLIEPQPVAEAVDRRCRSYRLTPPVISAWEALTAALGKSIGAVLEQFEPGALANADYRKWDPDMPARDQIDVLPPSRRLRLQRSL